MIAYMLPGDYEAVKAGATGRVRIYGASAPTLPFWKEFAADHGGIVRVEIAEVSDFDYALRIKGEEPPGGVFEGGPAASAQAAQIRKSDGTGRV